MAIDTKTTSSRGLIRGRFNERFAAKLTLTIITDKSLLLVESLEITGPLVREDEKLSCRKWMIVFIVRNKPQESATPSGFPNLPLGFDLGRGSLQDRKPCKTRQFIRRGMAGQCTLLSSHAKDSTSVLKHDFRGPVMSQGHMGHGRGFEMIRD
ncbi:hypothetical protein VTO42DRAFT_1513 [Malbranchea cinnamomea]